MTQQQTFKPQLKIPATYMRGGTSKGVFFNLADLPAEAQTAGETRDKLLLRIIGSPDPYAKHTDGMGGATSSTSKTVIISKSSQKDHDVDYLFGQVAIDKAFIDWSGNCGNLTAAVGAFAINNGLVDISKLATSNNNTVSIAKVRIWQANIQKTIVAHVPIYNGEVQETGDFELDGVTFPAAEVKIDFINPVDAEDKNSKMFPTGNITDTLDVPDVGSYTVTMINAGIPTVFLNAEDISFAGKTFTGTELQKDINSNADMLAMFEKIRAHAAVKMGLIAHVDDAKNRQHTPKIAFVAPPESYTASSGKHINKADIDLNVRALSMGQLHHAMMGTAAVAIGTAVAIPNTLVNLAAGGGDIFEVRFGHPSGTLKVGAKTSYNEGSWSVEKVSMSRSARRLMEGWVRVPDVL